MTVSSDSPTPRREFLGQMAASAIVLAGAACATPMSAAQTVATPSPAQPNSSQTKWDDSWTGRLASKHKAVFDSPEIAENATLGVGQAIRYINGVHEALGAEAQAVVVIRHKAIPFAFNDAMWEKYKIGEESKVKIGDAWATKNPLLNGHANGNGDRPQGNLVWLALHEHILLGCDLAAQGFAAGYAEKSKRTTKEVYEDLKANLVPGLILQPNGVYAVLRAQEAGCVYMRST